MAACMCAGDLRHRVELQSLVVTRDDVGGLIETWSTYATVSAKVEPMSVRESWYRQQMGASATWKISIRYRSSVVPQQRIAWGEHVFEIRGVQNPDMRKRFLELSCDEIVAAFPIIPDVEVADGELNFAVSNQSGLIPLMGL